MNLKEITDHINQKIAELAYRPHPVELYDPIRYLMALGGKRMRPLLTILGGQLFADNWQDWLKPAIAVEVFHNFTLMHDDIMDNAPLRRSKPTVHEKWNNNIAILSGDVMLVQAYDLMLSVEDRYLRQVLDKFNICAAEVCEGQQLDMNFEQLATVSEADYLEMIRRKTAVLLGFALELGGILAHASERNTQLLRQFGENIGLGFQLKDDLLDVYGDADKFGKQVGGDIIANKKTYLLIEALTRAQGTDRQRLEYWLAQKDFDKTEKVKAVVEIYNNLKIKELTENKINHYFQMGFAQLAQIEAEEPRKATLRAFIQALIERES
ncbi:MAG: polyprenyl synthetase family protein [Microscillaceae bacterium]|jgi:geranylgeranyl diphosphate synthase type II|nr:polyprenyl synthetase family protein [Microscillaceae bacterium]